MVRLLAFRPSAMLSLETDMVFTMFIILSLETEPCGFVSFFLHFICPATQALWASGESDPGVSPTFFLGGSWI